MGLISEYKGYGRFLTGLRGFLREKVTLAEAKETIRRRLQEREENFLRVLKTAIFDYPQSPYHPLLRNAGCEFGDIRDAVRRRGIEAALRADPGLAQGVYMYRGKVVKKNVGEALGFDTVSLDKLL